MIDGDRFLRVDFDSKDRVKAIFAGELYASAPEEQDQKAGNEDARGVNEDAFGKLKWDPESECWQTRARMRAGGIVEVLVESAEEDAEVVLARVNRAWSAISTNEQRLRSRAASQLLDTHNHGWNKGNPIGKRAFVRKMVLKSVAFSPDGSATLDYDDGDLFWGHTMWISVDPNGRFVEAGIRSEGAPIDKEHTREG